MDELVTYLSWNGMITSVFGLVASTIPIATATDLLRSLPSYKVSKAGPAVTPMYVAGGLLFIVFIFWFWQNNNLRQSQNKMKALKRIISTITGLEITGVLGAGIVSIFFRGAAPVPRDYSWVLDAMLFIYILDFIACCLLLHGMRTLKESLIKVFLVYNYLLCGVMFMGLIGTGIFFSFFSTIKSSCFVISQRVK